MISSSTPSDELLDVFGIGFGPANMALAIALDEYNASAAEHCRVSMAFAERRDVPEWHPDMLFDDASMQISFLKDLATFRNPQSPYTFVNFLKSADRLVDFTNRGSMVPLRIEFAAYLRWVAAQLSGYVRTGTEVRAVRPVFSGEDLDHFEIDLEGPEGPATVLARQVVVAAGLVPRLPEGMATGTRLWHSHHHLARVGAVTDPADIVVIGSGQSAAEVAVDVYRRFAGARVHLVSSRYGIAPSEQGPLVNRIFDPSAVDDFFDAPPSVRDRMDSLHRNANNGSANPELIDDLFDTMYRDRWLGRERLHFHRMSRLSSAVERGDGVEVEITHELTGGTTRLDADAVVLATGYRTFDAGQLLGDADRLLVRDERGRLEVDRDSRARLRARGPGGLYLAGQTEHLHGFGTSLLSVVAVRAGEIADSILTAHLSRHPRTRTSLTQERSHA